jgi:NADPH-dependent 2,4-dienoyl-CoA reductase/sulfur reductase-like enzyme/rhodanese-related sulfurtransferase
MKVVIIGGVAGGATAAARLRRLDEHAQIILLERGEYISYANCGLPYYVGGEIRERSALTLQTPQSFFRRFRIEVRTRHEATALFPEEKAVAVKNLETGESYRESYDHLILSPGAQPALPPIPGVDDPRVFTLRTVPDALRLREAVEGAHPRTAVVVGGGYIGLEAAENLAAAGLEVTVAEFADHVIAPLDYDMACDVHRYLRTKGIRLLLRTAVREIRPGPDGLLVRCGEETIPAGIVVLATGVRPESQLAKEAGLRVNDRGAIVTDAHMRTSHPSIYAVGDAAELTNPVTGRPAWVPLAGPANKQGRIAADNICGIPSEYRGAQGSSILKLFGMTVAATGLNEAAAREAGIDYGKVYTYSPSHATYYPGASNMSLKVLYENGTGRLLGAQLVGFEGVDKRCDVLATALRAGMTAEDLTELELCYAPPYSSAKDPVNMAGYVIENVLSGKVRQFHWHDVPSLPRDGSVTLLDTRTAAEYTRGHIEGFCNIPLDELREHLGELDPQKPVYVHCQSGLRSYIACRILAANGYECYNLAGGYRLYESVTGDVAYDPAPCHSCGLPVRTTDKQK